MTNWKQLFTNSIYFHHRVVAVIILTIGGCVSLWIVYHFLLTSAVVEEAQEQIVDVPINNEALERVTLWNKKIQQEGTVIIEVPTDVFDIPTPAP